MGARAINQRDTRPPLATEPITQASGEFKPTCAATDDDEAMFPGVSRQQCNLAHTDVFSRPNLEDSGILRLRWRLRKYAMLGQQRP